MKGDSCVRVQCTHFANHLKTTVLDTFLRIFPYVLNFVASLMI